MWEILQEKEQKQPKGGVLTLSSLCSQEIYCHTGGCPEGCVCITACTGQGDVPSACWDTPPPSPTWTDFLTHVCENITLKATTLRMINI